MKKKGYSCPRLLTGEEALARKGPSSGVLAVKWKSLEAGRLGESAVLCVSFFKLVWLPND